MNRQPENTHRPMLTNRLAISSHTMVSALGAGRAATFEALCEGRTGLKMQRFMDEPLQAWLGLVDGLDDVELPLALRRYDCRNNRLAWMALHTDGFARSVEAARDRHGAERIGVFVGTSTSGILEAELAYRHRDPATGALPPGFHYAETQNTWSVADFTRQVLGLTGPAHAVSTACSSSAKVFGTAARMMALGLIDAAVVGGVDTLCMTTLYGFNSLELVSPDICRPWDADRRGLSLGEAGAFALLEREDVQAAPMGWLLGVGESSDGYHMSSPLPRGEGAAQAMRAALAQAGLDPSGIDYVNLHGTGTPGNDASEDAAVLDVFGDQVPCSSTKGATGHTLGAAGGLEAGITLLALAHGMMPGGLNLRHIDPAMRCRYLAANELKPISHAASNSFGFGGSNACLVFGCAA